MKIWFAAAAALALAITAAPAMAQTDEDVRGFMTMQFGDAEPFVEAIDVIQAAVADGDAETFAEWISYPFRVTVDGEAYRFDGPEGVVEHYESMMTDEIKSAIVDQQFKDLFVNAEGVMFGNGQLWLSAICQTDTCEQFDVRIITVQSTAN
jgi:hypothetical protein